MTDALAIGQQAFLWTGSIRAMRGKGANNGNLLVRRARQQMNSYLGRSFGNLEIRGEWQLVGKRYNDVANTQVLGGYGLVNLYADYHLQKDWSVFCPR